MDKIKKILKDLKNQMIIMLTVLAVVGAVKNQFGQYTIHVLVSVGAAVFADFIGGMIFRKKKYFSTSAVVTGLIVGLVAAPDEAFWMIAVVSVVAILSKHIIKYKGRHIFNPAGFGLLFGMLVFNITTSWWGGAEYWLVIILGLIITYQLKSFPLVLTFLGVNLAGMAVIFYFRGIDPSMTFEMANYFLVFVMLVEHVTSPDYTKARLIYGAAAAVVSVLVLWLIPMYDPGIIGLSAANLAVPYLNSKFES